jgi:cholesterol transport system auxiliary component
VKALPHGVRVRWSRIRLGLITAAAAPGLLGCSGLFHSDARPTQTYVLRAATHAEADAGPALTSIRVGRPVAGPGLESDRIVLVQSDHRMSYYVASRWPAAVPEVVENLAVDTLRSSRQWAVVQDSSSALFADYILQIVVRRFEADYTANPNVPQVQVTLDCTVGRRAGRELIASFMATGSANAAANRLAEVVSAFEAASNKALTEVAAQTYQAVTAHQKVETPVPSITR